MSLQSLPLTVACEMMDRPPVTVPGLCLWANRLGRGWGGGRGRRSCGGGSGQYPLSCDLLFSGHPPYARDSLELFRQNMFCDATCAPNVVVVWHAVPLTHASPLRLVWP